MEKVKISITGNVKTGTSFIATIIEQLFINNKLHCKFESSEIGLGDKFMMLQKKEQLYSKLKDKIEIDIKVN